MTCLLPYQNQNGKLSQDWAHEYPLLDRRQGLVSILRTAEEFVHRTLPLPEDVQAVNGCWGWEEPRELCCEFFKLPHALLTQAAVI